MISESDFMWRFGMDPNHTDLQAEWYFRGVF